MKKIYAMALCGAVCLSAGAVGHRFNSVRGQKRVRQLVPAEQSAPIWHPESQTDFIHDGNGWIEMGTVAFKYDNRGNCTEELVDADGSLAKTVTTYNEYNLPLTVLETLSEDGESWENSSRLSYVYDPIIHSFFTERNGYDWVNDGWTLNYRSEANTITRNDEGKIIEVVKSLPLMNELTPAFKSVWNYGTDGKANEYFYYVAGEGGDWELYDNLSYRDIVWDKTDGQMTVFGDLLELTEGENLLKSAVVCYNGEPDGHYLVDYTDNGFFIRETTNDINVVGRTTQLQRLDSYGSLRLTVTEYFDEEGNILAEPTYVGIQEAIMDEHGNMTEYNQKEMVGSIEELVTSTKYSYTYDANGNVTEVVSEDYDYDSKEYFPLERTVYGQYVDVTVGIDGLTPDASELWTVSGDEVTCSAPGLTGLTVLNLQGATLKRTDSSTVSLADLLPGLYLIHADGTAATYRLFKR